MLHFHQLTCSYPAQDMANYTCVAENLAGKKYAAPVLVTVYGTYFRLCFFAFVVGFVVKLLVEI